MGRRVLLVFSNTKFSSCNTSDKPNNDELITKLTDAFKQYGFVSKVYRDMTKCEISYKINRIKKGKYDKYDCIVIVILSHGDRSDTVLASDNETYSVDDDVIKEITANNNLLEKHILVFAEVSRGPFPEGYIDSMVASNHEGNVMKCFFAAEGYGVTGISSPVSLLRRLVDKLRSSGNAVNASTIVDGTVHEIHTETHYVPVVYNSFKKPLVFERA